MSSSPTLNQVRFRVRIDGGNADTVVPTWAAAEDTSVSYRIEDTFRLRFTVNNTGAAAGAGPFILRVSKNAGAYTAVTTSSGASLGAQSVDASISADEATLATANFRLTAGTGTALAGKYDETGSATLSLTNAFYSELEYGVILKATGAAVANTFDFRIYNSTTAFTTYTQTPRITATAAETTGTDFQSKSTQINGSLASGGEYNSAGHSTYAITTTEACAVGDLVVVLYAVDNATTETSNSSTSSVTAMTDSAGNTYTSGRNQILGTPGGQAGVNAGIWYCQLTNSLGSGGTITATFSNSADRDAVAMVARSFAMPTGKAASVVGGNNSSSTSATPPSLNVTTSSEECLRVRVTGGETNTAQAYLARRTPGFSVFSEPIGNSGVAATSVTVAGEWIISTGTGGTSAPASSAAGFDQAAAYVAFKAVSTGDALLANDISSASDTPTPALGQTHVLLANDLLSP